MAIVRTSSTGDTTLATNANLFTCESGMPFCQHRRVWLDDRWLYWVANSTLTRLNLATLAQDTLVQDMADPPSTVAADGCNVYWTASDQTNPPSLWEMRR